MPDYLSYSLLDEEKRRLCIIRSRRRGERFAVWQYTGANPIRKLASFQSFIAAKEWLLRARKELKPCR